MKLHGKGISRTLFVICSLGGLAAAISAVLFFPPIRDRVFSTKLWPWPLPWDTTKAELEEIQRLCEPGDIVIESNLHGWQWIGLCLAATGTSWVHAAIVDENKRILTVDKQAIETDLDIYLRWGSTRLAVLRPDYQSDSQIAEALSYARSKLGTVYDASFANHAGNCNGLVASSLVHCGIEVPMAHCLGRTLYAPNCFLSIPGIEVIWSSDNDRRVTAKGESKR